MMESLSLSEFEGKIAEVESFLKSTEKMIQVQLEVVDRKIDKEIGGLKREINNKIEEQGVVLKLVREMIEREIGKLAADGLGCVEVKHSESFWTNADSTSGNGVHDTANKMLTPSFGEPGQCFPSRGSTGFVQIKLRKAIVPEAVTLEHDVKCVAYDRSSAPKDCKGMIWTRQ